jgi:hypothetical protein
MFLMIQNPGVAPVEGYTLLGVSTTRDCGVDGTIGMFGSGTKHAINTLLRANLKVFVYCGKTRLDFQTRDDEVDDGLVHKPVKRVMCKLSGTSTRTYDLGWVLDFGATDWTDLGMAIREFVSNAIDRTLREENGEFVPAIHDRRLEVAIVEDSKVRAKDGYTRVFIEADESVHRYMDELPKRFLHFSDRPEQVKQSILPKAGRNLNGKKTPMIYRAGVFVREVEYPDLPSVYDYNLKPDEVKIDECRNSSDYEIKVAIAKLYQKATTRELIPMFQAMIEGDSVYEEQLESYYVMPSFEQPKEEQVRNWQQAWQAVAADAVLCCPVTGISDFVQRKGYKVAIARTSNFVDTASRFGIQTHFQVLTESEKNGREILPATEAAEAAVSEVWGWLEKYNLTGGVEKPAVGCFRDVMNAGSRLLGFCDEHGVYLADDQAGTRSKPLLKTALEESIHWVTKATDGSRDLQDFAFRMIVEILA